MTRWIWRERFGYERICEIRNLGSKTYEEVVSACKAIGVDIPMSWPSKLRRPSRS